MRGFGGFCDLLGVWVTRGKEREERTEERPEREGKCELTLAETKDTAFLEERSTLVP